MSTLYLEKHNIAFSADMPLSC